MDNIEFVENAKNFEQHIEEKLFIGGRLFIEVYLEPENYEKVSAATYYDEDGKPVGVSVLTYGYTHGWRGDCDGLVGVYVKPEHRNKGIAKKLLQNVIDNTTGVLGHTPGLTCVAKALDLPDRLVRLG